MKIRGLPLKLDYYGAPEVLTSRHFQAYRMAEFERVYLPESMRPFVGASPLGSRDFVADDNRGAVSPDPFVSIDGTEFHLSVKGVGSTAHPFSRRPLGRAEVSAQVADPALRDRVLGAGKEGPGRYLTAELWQRLSPYGGQGLEHANYAMRASEMDDVTSIHGFRIAPLVKTVMLPRDLEENVRKVYWYRRFEGRMVQEARLVPSNVRIYFHSQFTVGGDTSSVFDFLEVDSETKARRFMENFVRSGIAFLTLFARSMAKNSDRTLSGLDFYDVWLDKDAVLAPDGTIYFVDLEGLEWVTVHEKDVKEKLYSQVFRSLYEFMYAYEQIERERFARFGGERDRKVQFARLLEEALRRDEVVEVVSKGKSLVLKVGNILGEERLAEEFRIVDW